MDARFTASLVVGADGAGSASRKLAGIETRGWDYEQRAFVTHVRTEHPHRAPPGNVSTSGSHRVPAAGGRSQLDRVDDHARTREQLGRRSGRRVGARKSVAAIDRRTWRHQSRGTARELPLALSHARQYCRPRFVLIGDAAHAVHPLAGQGVNLGFMDCAALVETLSSELARRRQPTRWRELRVLRRYERWRKSENSSALGLIDGLNRLFSNSSDTLSWMRRTGLALVNDSAFAKRALIGRAMGIAEKCRSSSANAVVV